MKFDIKIYGTHQRDFLIEPLKQSLNLSDDDVIYDDRPEGGLCMYNFRRAYTAPLQSDITHRLCLPDDMIVCDNFVDIVTRMINAHPDKIIVLFPYNFADYEDLYEPVHSPYIRNNGIITGNGIIIPVQYIEPFFKWTEKFEGHYDIARDGWCLSKWAKQNNIQVINTIPSTVQHIGDDYGTTLPHYIGPKNRKTGFFMQSIPADINWDCKDVLDYPNYEYDLIRLIRQDIKRGKGKFLDENFQPRKEL